METKTEKIAGSPPRLIPSLVAGFNAVANNIQLIIPPILLDLLIWFGPHLSLRELLEPIVMNLGDSLLSVGAQDMDELLLAGKDVWLEIIKQINLSTALRTLPVGIPSLMTGQGTLETPLGSPLFFEMPSPLAIVVVWIAIYIIGLAGGSLFYSEIARRSCNLEQPFSFKLLVIHFSRTLLLTLVSIILLIAITIPITIVISITSMINPLLTQIAIIFISLLIIWARLPLIFSPHGIFAYQYNILTSMLSSIRLVRYFLPGTGIFILIAVLISQGLDILWKFPPETSWMTLIGIFGHAFVTTSLVASSFIYYRGGVSWMQENLKNISRQTSQT
ncbi:MAG: hypothetical protein MUO76_07345 [Anaerolineaceae bacterium]|nr:hypothetical protein [Anaerolineaceae bacterium]